MNGRLAQRAEHVNGVPDEHRVRIKPDEILKVQAVHAHLEVMQFEQPVLLLELEGVVAPAPFERPVGQDMKLSEDARLPRRAHAAFHHRAVNAVADRPIAVFWSHADTTNPGRMPLRAGLWKRERDSKTQSLNPPSPMLVRIAQVLARIFRALT